MVKFDVGDFITLTDEHAELLSGLNLTLEGKDVDGFGKVVLNALTEEEVTPYAVEGINPAFAPYYDLIYFDKQAGRHFMITNEHVDTGGI